MGRPKGSKNGTSKVANTKPQTRKARTPKTANGDSETRSSVHSSTKRVRRPRGEVIWLEDKPSGGTKVASATRKPRVKKAISKARKQVVIYQYDHSDPWDWLMIATGVIVLILLGFIAAKVLS